MIHNSFPIIEQFSDIEHAIDRKMFMVAERDGHMIVNYLFASQDVFPDIDPNCDIALIRREFRGLIFDDAGNLIRRPFHKFFNVSERSETQLANIDVSRPHIIYDKLDGSMICPYITGIDLIWGTKMGNTDVAKQAAEFVGVSGRENYINYVLMMIEEGYSPIFEWCSRVQRIVLDYKQDKLVLTAVRDMKTGQYMSHDQMKIKASSFNIPVCETVQDKLSDDFIKNTKQTEDIEGYVIRFTGGQMVKIKCDWYCALHRVKSEIEFERGVVKLLIEGNMDDLKPLMPKDDLEAIDDYEEKFWNAVTMSRIRINNLLGVIHSHNISRKDFALKTKIEGLPSIVLDEIQPYEQQIIFKLWEDFIDNPQGKFDESKAIEDLLEQTILNQCSKNTKFDTLRKTKLFENVPVWRGVDINE